MAGSFQPSPAFQINFQQLQARTGFQCFPAFQWNFQQLCSPPEEGEGVQVVLFPGDYIEYKSEWDKMLYVMTILGREWSPRNPYTNERLPSAPKQRVYKTGLEYEFA